jgi:Cu(I)/Ag(I) efflux system membrane protein CusA/SilA
MPDLDEGSFLLMPTTMPHASIGEAMDVLRKQDMALTALPEVEVAVGKIGRAESPLDPAPISMIETVINYKSEYITDKAGHRVSFKIMPDETDLFRDEAGEPVAAPDGNPYTVKGKFVREDGRLIPDEKGKPFRLWRPPLDPELNPGRDAWAGIRNPEDIWQEIIRVTEIPGTTSAPKLQPIAARIVMLQSGMRAPMGVKIFGKGKVTLEDLEAVGIQMERLLKEVPSVKAAAVNAERIVGKPYLEIDIDRKAIARYSVNIADVQNVIQTAVGGMTVTTTVEGRERYNVLVRYKRELRDTIESLERVLIPAGPTGKRQQIPLKELIKGRRIQYRRGPQVIKSEESALVTYVLFDKEPGHAEVDVKEDCESYLQSKIDSGDLQIPEGITYKFAGTFENQIRSEKRLQIVLPLALFIIFMILYFQFRSVATSMLVFTGVFVAWSGGFIMIWLYGQEWFLNFPLFGVQMRELFQMQPINLSVAIWVGFLALFGIATDDGVVMATFLKQSFKEKRPSSVAEIREAALFAGERRVRPCLMTTATTILALLPVLTSTGRGADIMVPMAIPTFGGMVIEFLTMFVVPVLYCAIQEMKLKANAAT